MVLRDSFPATLRRAPRPHFHSRFRDRLIGRTSAFGAEYRGSSPRPGTRVPFPSNFRFSWTCFRNVIYRFLEVTDELQRRYQPIRAMGRQPCGLKVSNPIYVEHVGNLYETRDSHSMDGHFVRAFEAASKLQHKLVWPNRAARCAIYEAGKSVRMVFRISFQIDGRV